MIALQQYKPLNLRRKNPEILLNSPQIQIHDLFLLNSLRKISGNLFRDVHMLSVQSNLASYFLESFFHRILHVTSIFTLRVPSRYKRRHKFLNTKLFARVNLLLPLMSSPTLPSLLKESAFIFKFFEQITGV